MSIYLFPHGENEFESAKQLASWMRGELARRRGVYRVITARRYTSPRADDLVIFCRAGLLVGEAWIKKPLRKYPKPRPIADGVYEGELVFYHETLKVYGKPKGFEDLRAVGFEVNAQSIQRLSPVVYRSVLRPK